MKTRKSVIMAVILLIGLAFSLSFLSNTEAQDNAYAKWQRVKTTDNNAHYILFSDFDTLTAYSNWVDIAEKDAQTLYLTYRMTDTVGTDATTSEDTIRIVMMGAFPDGSCASDCDTQIVTNASVYQELELSLSRHYPSLKMRLETVGDNNTGLDFDCMLYATKNDNY